jgi:hypothetical protein
MLSVVLIKRKNDLGYIPEVVKPGVNRLGN